MKILILGTSNSLIKGGWVDGLKSSLNNCHFTNLSIGASPGIQFTSLINLDYESYDYVFFDSVPNDEDYQYDNVGYSDIDFTSKILKEVFSTISSKTKLIILGLSTKNHFKSESSVLLIRRHLAMQCEAEFVDIRYILDHYSDFFICRSGKLDLYDTHPSHPLPEHMRFIGESIGREILSLTHTQKNKIASYENNYLVWAVGTDAPSGTNTVEMSNSLLSESFANIEDGSILNFPVGFACIGFYVNYHTANACIHFLSEDNSEIGVMNVFAPLGHGFIKLFVPVPNGILASKIKISALSRDKAYTPTMFSSTPRHQQKAMLQISHLVFRKETLDVPTNIVHVDKIHSLEKNTLTRSVSTHIESLIHSSRTQEKKIKIIDNWGRCLYFNMVINQCVFLNLSINPEPFGKFFPVRLIVKGSEIELYADIYGSLFLLSIYTGGISLSKAIAFSIPTVSAPSIGTSLNIIKATESSINLKCETFYLSSLPDGSLGCQRPIAKSWELFEIRVPLL